MEYEVVWWVRGVKDALKAGKIARREVERRLGQRGRVVRVNSVIDVGSRSLVKVDIASDLPASELEKSLHVHVEDPNRGASQGCA